MPALAIHVTGSGSASRPDRHGITGVAHAGNPGPTHKPKVTRSIPASLRCGRAVVDMVGISEMFPLVLPATAQISPLRPEASQDQDQFNGPQGVVMGLFDKRPNRVWPRQPMAGGSLSPPGFNTITGRIRHGRVGQAFRPAPQGVRNGL